MRALSGIIIILVLLVSPLFPESLGTKARINEKGNIWVLDKGISHGVTLGLEGYLMKKIYSPTNKKWVPQKIAHYKVSKVFQIFCHAKVDKWTEGFSAKDARWAQFIKHLTPPKGTKKVQQIKERVPEVGKTPRWYLDKGDDASDRQKYALAIEYYEKVREKDPDDPGAISRLRKAKGKYFVQQGDLDYTKGESLGAYEYYIMAFQILRENGFTAAEKILDLWNKDEGFYEKTKEYEISPEVILESLVNYCDELLEGNQLDRLSVLAQKVKEYADNLELRNKLDTLSIVKEIQENINSGNTKGSLALIKDSIEENNLYKANYIINQLEKLAIDDETTTQLTDLKEELRSKKTQMEIQKEVERIKQRIKKLKEEAEAFVTIKKYDEAIERYLEMYRLEPDKKEYGDKIKELQLKKHKFEKSQKEMKSIVERNGLILEAEDYFQKDLMQDAMDYYIKAYKVFPEEGKAVAGVVTVLEKCGPDDAKFITSDLLGRKLSKFTKDFLSYLEKEYLNSKDEQGLAILTKIIFISSNRSYDDLMLKFKTNLYTTNLKLGYEQYKIADFDKAETFYQNAQRFQDTPEIKKRLTVCRELKKMLTLLQQDRKKELGQIFSTMVTHPNKYEIADGLLYLSEKYLDNSNLKRAKYLYKKVDGFQIYKFKDRIEKLKKKAKEMKKKR
jgi:hypothetical protein